ncbi:DUF6767 domain-containing protein [uncultured Corynebacterium sp.]|uniref:DUF6767 domain-containing protein n=1 Tax=uncultured Corynebacterium sp. TaxID=159447 RepID=UPI00344B1D52
MISGNAHILSVTRVGEKRATPTRAAQSGSVSPALRANPGTSGPADCQLVQMVRMDPELMERMRQMNLAHRHTS